MYTRYSPMPYVILLIVLLAVTACNNGSGKVTSNNEPVLFKLQDALSDAIVHDGFSPPVASRIYAYTAITLYEAARINNDTLPSFSGKLNGFNLNLTTPKEKINNRVVMVTAFSKVATEMVYRDYVIDSVKQNCLAALKKDISNAEFERSVTLGNDLAGQILAWAAKDKYKETRTMPRYTQLVGDEYWIPTPPTYTEAIEPYWGTIRPFVLDSGSEFTLPPPPAFGKTASAPIYHDAIEVMEAAKSVDTMQLSIAEYWDCNPLRTYTKGHIMFNKRQLTPGGHWVAITKYACLKTNVPEAQAAWYSAITSITLADAFIACWEQKFRYSYIRPETYINKYINPTWKPHIETPPFPEYPSGHSVISASAATVLSEMFGDSFSFVDSAEVPFDKAPRAFYSFRDAANEAARSRVVAGIHFTPACNNGIMLGNKVGDKVIKRLIKK